MIKKKLVIWLFLGVCSTIFSQKLSLPTNPDEYIVEVGNLISRQKNPVSDSVYTRFQTTWTSLSDSQQVKFVEINQLLFELKYPIQPYYPSIMNIVHHAVSTQNMQGEELDEFLEVLKLVTTKYTKADYNLFLKTTGNFLEHNIVFQNNNHTYYAYNTKFKFRFVDESSSEDEYVPYIEEEETEEEDYAESFDDWDEDAEDSYDDWEDEYYDDEENYFDDYDEYDDYEEEYSFDDYEDEEEENYDDVEWGDEDETAGNDADSFKETVLEIGYAAPDLPIIKGAIIDFTGGDFVIQTKYDSVAIKNIDSASFEIKNYQMIAQGGSMDWSSAGLGSDVNGTFKQYVFKTSEVNIQAEGFTLNYDQKLDEPVEGIFAFKSEKHDTVTQAKYPRFMSYNANINLKDLGPDIKYKGGFSLNGQKIYSNSVNEARSIITVSHGGIKKFVTKARFFEIGDSVITGEPASIMMYTSVDSLFHPSAKVTYKQSIPELVIQNDRSEFKRKPFEDKYHGFDLYVTTVFWDFNDTIIKFLNLKARHEVGAQFDSRGHYNETDYYTLKGMYRFHPLQMAVNYEILNKVKGFTTFQIAEKYKLNHNQVVASMKSLWYRGFIDYNPLTGYVKIKEKGYHFVAARKSDEDYDNIRITSLNPGEYNASWNTVNNELSILGVKSVSLSDSMNVNFEPKDGQLKIRQNKNIVFDGRLMTNNFMFSGREFDFNYDLYQIELTHIDSINFSVDVTDSLTGKSEKKTLDNKLSYSSGTLFLNEADNKSGAINNPKYPYFDATHGATVFFDKKDILNGAYDRRIFFKIPPFDVDSLANNVEESVGFDGTFISGIFPDIEEKLVMMNDYSFGFNHKVPEEGYPLYGGHGRFFGDIRLDKQGLRGKGKIVFLNTTLESTDFIFYSDSTTGIGDNVNTIAGTHPDISQSITFPSMSGFDYTLKWLVQQDSMIIMNNADPFIAYDSSALLTGNSIVASTGMYGDGILETEGALTISRKFTFEERRFTGRDAQFEILTEIANKPAVRSDYVKIVLDFDERKAKFNPERKGVATNEFPYLQYKTSIDEGIWDMNKRIVKMQVPEGEDVKNSYFYSTRLDQDSIAFNATEAIYSMDSLELHVEGVPEILIADARIIPAKNELYIKENAVINTLKNCQLVVDTLNEYHKLINGEIDILTKNKFEGNATYQYVNFGNDTLPIQFNRFDLLEEKVSRKVTQYHTKSTGNIFQEDSFYLQPKMLYRGMATMYAQKRLLDLEGYVKLDLRGAVPSPDWLKYDQKEDIDEIQIPLADQQTSEGNPMISGIHYSVDEQALYGTFLGEKRSEDDITLFSADGYLIYDDDENFNIGEFESIKGGQFSGNTFVYNENKEEFHYKGLLSFVRTTEDKKDSHVTFDMAGEGDNVIVDTLYTAHGLGKIKFDIPSAATDILAQELEKATRYIETELSMVIADHDYLGNVAAFIGEKATDKYQASSMVGVQPLYSASKFFDEGFVFNNLKLEWSNKNQAWYGHGPMGLGNVNKTNFNLKFNSYIEIKNTEEGSIVNLYLELDKDNWFYFAYDAFSLNVASSYDNFDDYVDSKSLIAKNEPKGLYYFAACSRSQVSGYIKRFINTYLDGEGLDNVPVFEDAYEDPFADDEFDEDIDDEPEFVDDLDDGFIDDTETYEEELPEIEEEIEEEADNKRGRRKDKEEDEQIEEPLDLEFEDEEDLPDLESPEEIEETLEEEIEEAIEPEVIEEIIEEVVEEIEPEIPEETIEEEISPIEDLEETEEAIEETVEEVFEETVEEIEPVNEEISEDKPTPSEDNISDAIEETTEETEDVDEFDEWDEFETDDSNVEEEFEDFDMNEGFD